MIHHTIIFFLQVFSLQIPYIKVSKVNVLLYGPAGSGKSSLLRSVDTIFQGHVSRVVDAGSATASLTRELRKMHISKFFHCVLLVLIPLTF